MSARRPLSDAERLALRTAPPRDGAGRLAPWTLGGVELDGEEFAGPVEHEGLTLHDASLRGFTWSGGAVLRGCVLRDVAFERVAFKGLVFEDVTFERCRFDTAQWSGCRLTRCRFVGGEATLMGLQKTVLEDTSFTGVAGDSWTLRECRLAGCELRDCTLVVPRLTKCALEGLAVEGGVLRGAELTLLEGDGLRIAGATVERLRVLGGSLRSLVLVEVEGDDLTFSSAELGALRFERCLSLTGPRVLDCTIGALTFDRCAEVLGLVVHGTALGQTNITRSELAHTSLVAVRASGALRVGDSGLAGLIVREGTWAGAAFERARLADYFAVDRARFTSLRRSDLVEAEGLRYLLDGAALADGAALWRALHGP